MKTIRLFLLDDEPQVRQGLRMRLDMEPDFDVVGEAGDGLTALDAIRQTQPDIVLTDIQMPGPDGISLVPELRSAGCRVVMVSMEDDAATRARAASAGADGFVGKHEIDSALTQAIRSAAARGPASSIDGSTSGRSADEPDHKRGETK
jgi:DNA-binding NarL/FixJ family response regulator